MRCDGTCDGSCWAAPAATVQLDGWWFNLRPSNTEPLLRLNLEAPTASQVTERVAEVRSAFGLATSDR